MSTSTLPVTASGRQGLFIPEGKMNPDYQHPDDYDFPKPWLIVIVLLGAALSGGLMAYRMANPSPPSVTVSASSRHPSEVEVCREIAERPNWRAGVEVKLHDDCDGQYAGHSRIDILTDTHAFEADWAHKWTEAVGQSLYYSQQWGEEHPRDTRKPGIILLVRDPDRESHYVVRCRRVCDQYNITLVVETVR